MYVSLTRVSTGNEPIENATIVGEELERWLREIEGFAGFLMLSSEGTSIGLSFWETREVAEHHLASRMQFIDRMLSAAGVRLEEIVGYDVTFARLGALTIDSTL